MSSKLALVQPVIMPPQVNREARSFMPADKLNKIKKAKFMQAVPERERGILLDEINGALAARMMQGVSGLALGAHLTNIQEISKKYRIFDKCLRLIGGISIKTSRRYMDGYRNAALLPGPVVKAMMLKGLTITPTPGKPLGKYTTAVRQLQPPRSPDPEKAVKYVQQVEDFTKERRSRQTKARKNGKALEAEPVTGDPEVLLEQAFRAGYAASVKLPNNAKTRRKFLESLVGMLMTQFGIQSPHPFAPEAIPESFIPKRGRPALVEKEEKTAAGAAS